MPMIRYFLCFEVSEPTIDLLQNDLQRKSSLIIILTLIRGVFRNNVVFFNNFAMLCSMVIKLY